MRSPRLSRISAFSRALFVTADLSSRGDGKASLAANFLANISLYSSWILVGDRSFDKGPSGRGERGGRSPSLSLGRGDRDRSLDKVSLWRSLGFSDGLGLNRPDREASDRSSLNLSTDLAERTGPTGIAGPTDGLEEFWTGDKDLASRERLWELRSFESSSSDS